MAVKRNTMAQALARPQTVQRVSPVAATSQYSNPNAQLDFGQGLINKAVSGQGFDPQGGWGVAAAQIATAGIGAWAQNRARKEIAEKEVASQQQFAKQFPQYADMASQLSPETRQAYTVAKLTNDLKAQDPSSQLDLQKTQAEINKLNAETSKAYKEAKTAGVPSAPAGYSYNPDGSLKAIKGGPADKTTAPLSQDAAKTLTIANDGLGAISNIQKQFTDPKTGQFLGEKFSKITGGSKFLPSLLQPAQAQEFSTYQANLVDTIGRLRSGGAINGDEEKRFLNMVPQFGDKPATFDTKLKQLKSTFNSVQTGIDPSNVRNENPQPIGKVRKFNPQTGGLE